MLTIRPFTNVDPVVVLEIWNENVGVYPSQFFSLSADILDSQLFGSVLFDPNGFLIAEQNGKPVGFIHASFPSNLRGNGIDPRCGIIHPPLLRPGCEFADEVRQRLLEAAEHFLIERGVVRCRAGGRGGTTPFYTGLYGRTSPFGIFAEDRLSIDLFEQAGYTPIEYYDRLRLNLTKYQTPHSQALLETHRRYVIQKTAVWKPRDWWDANIHRNFHSYEWVVRERNQAAPYSAPIAGAVVHQMMGTSLFLQNQYSILSYIGVQAGLLRRGIGSVLFAVLINDLQFASYVPMMMDTVADQRDIRLRRFLEFHSFEKIGEYIALTKQLKVE